MTKNLKWYKNKRINTDFYQKFLQGSTFTIFYHTSINHKKVASNFNQERQATIEEERKKTKEEYFVVSA